MPLGALAVDFSGGRFASVYLVGFATIFTSAGFIGLIVLDRKTGYLFLQGFT